MAAATQKVRRPTVARRYAGTCRNTVAVITGGAQGFGKGFARAVLNGGGKVSLLDVKENVGGKTEMDFNNQFGPKSALFIKCDVRRQTEVKAAFRQTWDVYGKINLVINNAGVATAAPEHWENTLDINLKGVILCCLTAAEYMSADKPGCNGGHIINIASAAGLTGMPDDFAYTASKHGVVGLSRSLSLTWEPQSIRVSCMCPTFADTEMLQLIEASPTIKAVAETMGVITVDEVVDAFKQLCENPHETGGVMLVNKTGTTYRHKPRLISARAKL